MAHAAPARRPCAGRSTARPFSAATLLGLVAGVLVVLAGPLAAPASAADGLWEASGPSAVLRSDGETTAARMTYDLQNAGFSDQTWEMTTTFEGDSGEGGSQLLTTVPWTWQGSHAWYDVTVRLRAFVEEDGAREYVDTPVDESGAICCDAPSGSFTYSGVTTFTVPAGATYGFELTGRNTDSNNFLRGSFVLSNVPYTEELGTDNRDWRGAEVLRGGTSTTGAILQPGESRWYKIPVVPGQNVSATLSGLPADYDAALYGDIGQAYQRLTEAQDLTQAALLGGGVTDTQVPVYPESVQVVPDESKPPVPGATFAPNAYAPNAYAPNAYAPNAYAPNAYAPNAYAPNAYAPNAYAPSVPEAFQTAFTTAQAQSLIAIGARNGTQQEVVGARSGNTDGFYYVRVHAHSADDSSTRAFTLGATVTGGSACAGLDDGSGADLFWDGAPSTNGDYATVIVTDTSRITYGTDRAADEAALTSALDELADATDGVVLDLAKSSRVGELWDQAMGRTACPFAMNLVAEATDDLVEQYQVNSGSARYVVVAGGDDVVPFFRYPDVSGLGQESQFDGTVRDETASGQSLDQDQVLGQDAYGSATEVTVGGAVFPVPDLAVGRLVKTAAEITATIDHYVADGVVRDLPAPTSSLVTGYDFLEDAARAMDTEFEGAMRLGPEAADELITPSGTAYDQSWTAADLRAALREHHDLTYLAGHFSANDTLAADFSSTMDARELRETGEDGSPRYDFADSLVLSAGCHSGYSIVDRDSDALSTYDWTQAFADQKAVLVAGTGYQYGDTEFLEYSERIYLNLTRNLRRGTAGTAVPIGEALADAKRDYLASLSSVTGIDQKAVLQATMYGLPMVGVDVPGRSNPSTGDPQVQTQPLSGAGEIFGLSSSAQGYDSALAPDGRDRPQDAPAVAGSTTAGTAAAAAALPDRLTWLEDADGVSVQPGKPVLPKRVVDVTVGDKVLRGVGFRGGRYTDTSGVLPLTGAPGIEGSTSHTTFDSDRWWPEKPWSTNYFDAVGRRGERGRTSLVLTRAQYRNDGSGSLTNTRRAYQDLDLELFYSDNPWWASSSPAYQAAAPGISGVEATEANGVVTFSARVTGDPSAGVQKVWVTWTGTGADSGHGTWRSVDLAQDAGDSTRWTGTLPLPEGQSRAGLRFLVQAVNGVGAVSLDPGEGDGYAVTEATVDDVAITSLLTPGATIGGYDDVTVQLTGARVRNRAVAFSVTGGGRTVESVSLTDSDGSATMQAPLQLVGGVVEEEPLPQGPVTVTASVQPITGLPFAGAAPTFSAGVTVAPLLLTSTTTTLVAPAGAVYPSTKVRLTRGTAAVAGATVRFTVPSSGPSATFAGGARTATAVTLADGSVTVPRLTAGTTVGSFALTVSSAGATDLVVPMAAQYSLSAFLSPVKSGTVTTTRTGTVPLKTTASIGRTKLSDAAAQALVSAGRVEVSWTRAGSTQVVGRSTTLARYDAGRDFFQADVKPSALGWSARTSYVVTLRILDSVASSPVDLGSRSATIKVS